MSFDKQVCLCNQHHNQDLECLHHPQKFACAHWKFLLPRITTDVIFIIINVSVLEMEPSCKWRLMNELLCVWLVLLSLTECFESHFYYVSH